jgi:hypothetical protein
MNPYLRFVYLTVFVNYWDNTRPHYRAIGVQWICRRKQSCSRFKYRHAFNLEGLTNSMKSPAQDSWCLRRDLNTGLPIQEAVLPTRPRHSVSRNSTNNKTGNTQRYVKPSHNTYGDRLGVFENRVPTTAFRSKRDGGRARWTKLCNDGLHVL